MATLTVTNLGRAGSNLATAAVAADAGGDKWLNSGATFLYIENLGVGSITLTLVFASTATIDGQSPTNRTVSVGASVRMLVGPFPSEHYNDSGGHMNVSYSGVTSVKVAPFLSAF